MVNRMPSQSNMYSVAYMAYAHKHVTTEISPQFGELVKDKTTGEIGFNVFYKCDNCKLPGMVTVFWFDRDLCTTIGEKAIEPFTGYEAISNTALRQINHYIDKYVSN